MEKTHGLKGLNSIKTMKNVKKRSIDMAKNSSFLELYILEKERERLVAERRIIEQKLNGLNKRLKEIAEEVKEIQTAKGYAKKTLENKKDSAPINPNKKEQKAINKVQFDY